MAGNHLSKAILQESPGECFLSLYPELQRNLRGAEQGGKQRTLELLDVLKKEEEELSPGEVEAASSEEGEEAWDVQVKLVSLEDEEKQVKIVGCIYCQLCRYINCNLSVRYFL